MAVYKDKKYDTWYCQFWYTDWQGERRYKKRRGFERKKDAQAWEDEFLKTQSRSCDMLFESFLDIYLADIRQRFKISTVETKESIIDTHIRPYFAQKRMNKITSVDVREWQNVLLAKGYAPTYLYTIHAQLSAVFNYAVRHYDLARNPARVAGGIGKKKAPEMKIWTLEEFNKFIAVVDKPGYKTAFEVLFWTGMRRGECLALTKNDILSSPAKAISINKNLYVAKDSTEYLLDPKTEKSDRVVEIDDVLYDGIIGYANRLYGLKDDERIFYFSPSSIGKELKRYAEIAGVKSIRIHDLRHSHAAYLIELGYNILMISKRLGHDNPQITLEIYGHLYPNKSEGLIEKLNEFKKS